jgi:hypothetical protein
MFFILLLQLFTTLLQHTLRFYIVGTRSIKWDLTRDQNDLFCHNTEIHTDKLGIVLNIFSSIPIITFFNKGK